MMSKHEAKAKTAAMENSPQDLKSLIIELGSENKVIREKARETLLRAGEPAVGPLVTALSDQREKVRKQAGKILDEMQVNWVAHANGQIIDALVKDLSDNDGIARVRAREALVTIGRKSVTALSKALKDKNEGQRWEAAKALGQIGDQAAVGALVEALEDKIFDVRWLAAEGLIKIGKPSVIPILQRLIDHSDSVWVREGAHHVFHDIYKGTLQTILQPVIKTLEDNDAVMEAPLAAKTALDALLKNNRIGVKEPKKT